MKPETKTNPILEKICIYAQSAWFIPELWAITDP